MPSFVVSIDGRRHLPTLFHVPTASSIYTRDPIVLEKRADDITSQLRLLPNIERLIFYRGPYTEAEIVQYLGVLPDWPRLRQIDSDLAIIKSLVTLKHLHSRLPAVDTLSMGWTWNPHILQNDLVFWSEHLRDLTLIVRLVQHVDWR